MSANPLRISFCTTCMGRLEHLKETLPQNLANTVDYPNAEFVILAYGDRKVFNWVKANFPEEIKQERIKLAYTKQEYFRMSHAKNMAHRLGDGDVLVNLDADNVLEKGFAQWLDSEFKEGSHKLVRVSSRDAFVERRIHGKEVQGIGGRLAIHKHSYEKLHGYDEKINAWGGDDIQLEARATSIGMKKVAIPTDLYGRVIKHTNVERYENMSHSDQEKSIKSLGSDSQKNVFLRRLNTAAILAGLKKSSYATNLEAANPDGLYGCGEVSVLQRDGREETLDLAPKPHSEWVASYDKASMPERPSTGLAR